MKESNLKNIVSAKYKWVFPAIMMATLLHFPSRSTAQSQEVQQLLLNVEKLAQFKKILENMYEGYKFLEEGYNKVRDVASGNFKLHQLFLDGLFAVNPEIKKYKRIPDIITDQLALVREYKSALRMFRNCGQFNDEELGYLTRVYDDLFKESLRNIDALMLVITANQFRMSDDERLQSIDFISQDMRSKLDFLRHFNKNNHVLALQRLKENSDVEGLKKLYELK